MSVHFLQRLTTAVVNLSHVVEERHDQEAIVPAGRRTILPLLWRAADAKETAQGPRVAARRVEPEIALAEEFAAATAPVVDVRRAFVEAGVPIVEGGLRQEPSQALARLEILLAPRRLTPLIEEAGDQTVRIIGLPMMVDAQNALPVVDRRESGALPGDRCDDSLGGRVASGGESPQRAVASRGWYSLHITIVLLSQELSQRFLVRPMSRVGRLKVALTQA